MRADVVDNDQVRIYVEDSGPGIPPQKQKELFTKYQESLDLLSQGTGIGLHLSKKLMQIMGGDLWLNSSYNSGVEGCPGACFVVDLRTQPIDIESALPMDRNSVSKSPPPTIISGEYPIDATPDMPKVPPLTSTSIVATKGTQSENNTQALKMQEAAPSAISLIQPSSVVAAADNHHDSRVSELPDGISVLFVDDDAMLRKLFMRAVKRAAPVSWKIHEASSGEVALKLCEGQDYDLIFLDQ